MDGKMDSDALITFLIVHRPRRHLEPAAKVRTVRSPAICGRIALL